MSTQRRAWIIRAAVIAVVAAAGLIGVSTPALADGESLSDISLDPGTVAPGQQTTVHFTVSVTNGQASTVSVTSSNPKVNCVGVCAWSNVSMPTGSKPYSVSFLADGNFQTDESATLTIQAGAASSTQTLNIKVPPVPTVPEVSGVVVNLYTGQPVPLAKVYLQDSANPVHQYDVGTDTAGKFKFLSTPAKPILPGTLAFRVEKEGWQNYDHTEQANPGVALTGLRLSISLTTATADPTPTGPAPTGGATPTLDDGNTSTTGPTAQTSSFSWTLIGIGGVLVLLGIGAIALLIFRRRDDGPDDDGRPRRGGGPPGRGPAGRGEPGMRPPRRGGPGPDRVGVRGPGDPGRGMRPPVSPGPRGGDQTMIARSPLADIPTQMHGRLPNEHADPYTAPGRHAQPGPAYGGGYGQPDPYGQHGQPPPGYGPPPAGYGQPGGYDPNDPRTPRSGPPQKPNRHVNWIED